MSSNSKVFLQGTLILTISGIVVKVIGALNWVFLSRVLGGEGIGLYQMGFPIYLMALTLSTAGIPVAISILTAEKLALDDFLGARRIYLISKKMLFWTGAFFMILMIVGASLLIDFHIIRDERAYWSIIALAPAVFIVTYMSSMRGYLQGWQKMAPTALSEIVEQFFRVATMIFFAWLFLPYGLEYGAAGASMGAAVGGAMGLIILVFCIKRLNKITKEKYIGKKNQTKDKESDFLIIKKIFNLAFPIALSSIMLPIVANLDMMIVPMRLEAAGFTTHQATTFFGYLTGMALPLINLATILTVALSIALVPAISSSKSISDFDAIVDKTGTAFRISTAVTVPSSVAIFLLAEPIARIVYNSPGAASVIKISSIAIFFLGLHQISTSVLQGLGFTRIPVISMAFAAVIKVFLNWHLVAIPSLGIVGSSWATIADMAVAAFINIYFVWKNTGFSLEFGVFIKTCFATFFMGLGIILSLQSSVYIGSWSLLLAVILGVCFYIPVMLKIGALPKNDVAQVPLFGKFLLKLY